MTENDIYDSKKKYEDFKANLEQFLVRPEDKKTRYAARSKYYCKNPVNLQYFKKLFLHFDARDTSYIRRCRSIDVLKIICFVSEKDLKECEREDINKIVGYMHMNYKSPESKMDFLKNIKSLWKVLFTEIDEKGRLDETIVPYCVRHLSGKIDKSKQKLRNDRLTWEEFEKILDFFSSDYRMQAYLFLALESLGRPQELLYLKLKDIELYDNYAKIWISEHGKEGTGFLQCIDSYPYVSRWYNMHPFKNNIDSYFFLNLGRHKQYQQLKPENVAQILRNACRKLGIKKSVTGYSLKRNGVTFRRLRGDSDVEIQHAARWTSTKQLKIYDMSQQEDAFKMELVKRGIINTDSQNYGHLKPKTKTCMFCKKQNALTNETCENCHRVLDRDKIREQEKEKEVALLELKNEVETLKANSNNTIALESQPKQIQDLFNLIRKLQEEMQYLKR